MSQIIYPLYTFDSPFNIIMDVPFACMLLRVSAFEISFCLINRTC